MADGERFTYLTIDSGNAKLVGRPRRGICASLALPIKQTCPPACPVRSECYAQGGRMRMKVRRIEDASEGLSPLEIARNAACEMDTAANDRWAEGRPLRLFESGDARTVAAAETIAAAGRGWLRRGGIAVWGYTHAWRRVPRESWTGVSIFASVESYDGAVEAVERGYTPARIFDRFPSTKAFDDGGIMFIPCPAQTTDGEIPCVRCRLCFDDRARAATGTAIAFEAHGFAEARLKRRLPVMRDRRRVRDYTTPHRESRHPAPSDDRCFVPTLECQSVEWTSNERPLQGRDRAKRG